MLERNMLRALAPRATAADIFWCYLLGCTGLPVSQREGVT